MQKVNFAYVLRYIYLYSSNIYVRYMSNQSALKHGLRTFTLYNVCSVHRGMFSTSGGVQYIGGIP